MGDADGRASVAACVACLALLASAGEASANTPLRLTRYTSAKQVELITDEQAAPQPLAAGQRVGAWTFITGLATDPPCAVFEDVEHMDGRVLFVDTRGVRLDLAKTSEASSAKPESSYLGHSAREILASPTDLLGTEILARRGADDPEYAEVASVFAPIDKIRADTFTFLGAPETDEKVAFGIGGRSPSFDPAVYSPSIESVRKAGGVRHGLVGGSLPVLRFVYPDAPGNYTELVAFAPRRVIDGNVHHQPVWYRVTRVEHGALRFMRYVDTYLTLPPRRSPEPAAFYTDLLQLKAAWDDTLAGSMQLELPDARLENLARYSLIRAIMTRVADDYPRYGVFDRDYGGSEHEGFEDTFNVETSAMSGWGLTARAGRYIDNYFGHFVRDDGSVLYRGDELGQYGRMLSVVAEYAGHGGDPAVLLTQRAHIDALTRALLALRRTALQLPAASAAHGLLAGFSEADSCLEAQPERYVQPYFSNSMLAARGFNDLGRVWARLGRERSDEALRTWGETLQREGAALQQDVARAIERSWLSADGTKVLPAIAGASEPPDRAVQRDRTDPQFRAYRAFNEMLGSGLLSNEQLRSVLDYRARHHDVLLGIPTAYSKPELAGFLGTGYALGLLQADRSREALLMLYAMMAHQYTRGAWVAPETRLMFEDYPAAPYCTPAQLFVPLMARWLLVFEEPETLWLGRAVPRAWLRDGQVTRVKDAPTRWGRVSFELTSQISGGVIRAHLQLPAAGIRAPIKLRLRSPTRAPMKRVLLNAQPWTAFDTAAEVIDIPAGKGGSLTVEAYY